MFRLVDTNNKPVPFGAMVNSVAETSQEVRNGIVSDNGQVYMAGLPLEGALSVQWGKKASQQCRANYQFSDAEKTSGIQQSQLVCHY
ncbi:FimD/PapC C-terminal domain-containing protein [Klebsiella pneumoniae]|nr:MULTISPECIES: FimD/PapC C-terminal domain-containing protein [Klebsiella]MDU2837102.1 FimD/PapC C-terminal domain-containing protein [Klebsiella pneumoniae]MDX4936264.1 FimD/PapC C-terminal domain-containing protein [Klebsiella pneumoniae]MDX4961287.1 FimD/PapC C-terminal domain-containing protein [Klebsiella pneumoniae]HBW5087308.1 hypothetical protein [Klebsiella pneumoniae]